MISLFAYREKTAAEMLTLLRKEGRRIVQDGKGNIYVVGGAK